MPDYQTVSASEFKAKCLDILDQSVVIRVNASEPVTLWLNGR